MTALHLRCDFGTKTLQHGRDGHGQSHCGQQQFGQRRRNQMHSLSDSEGNEGELAALRIQQPRLDGVGHGHSKCSGEQSDDRRLAENHGK